MQSEGAQKVAQQIHILRQWEGWTLRKRSDRCALSVSFLSQIERGLFSFSVPSLRSICQALDVSLPDLLVVYNGPGPAVLADPRPPEITKGNNRSYINLSDTSIKYRFPSGDFSDQRFEILIGETSPGCRNSTSSHEGEEFGCVLEGRVRLTIGEESYNLGPGDSYHLLSATPHVCQANDKEGAKVLRHELRHTPNCAWISEAGAQAGEQQERV